MKAKPSIHEAAAVLVRAIPAPRGAINTLASTEGRSKVIRVLVDPMYRLTFRMPQSFMGYRVTVEVKEPSVADYGR